ncbi:MAG: DUF1460 domain-containing protein [Melioribacteraceae bacterium]|nr:DUF1460 domain-containing protein [Melioribacteraceae bacterium]MCF8353274.1 DUF1460 domain-containing protein [Melioribacteraceae bacterium]MCF8394840.1 DUF1460 domain-containing protein [Melioribacteraceae bacterium]MCF8418801.1 DUF1460 domain-containing protein [Melioribacteraceae bacterium]
MFLILLIMIPFLNQAQDKLEPYTTDDVQICDTTLTWGFDQKLFWRPIHDVVVRVGKRFIGGDYISKPLDQTTQEELTINLRGFDCYTYLEAVLALSRSIKKRNMTFADFQNEIEMIRYRNGKRTDYTSRLHYFSDWFYEMNSRKIVSNITQKIGGIPYENKISFMSSNPDKYEQLKDNPEFVEEIKKIEEEISKREYYYIPQEKLDELESQIMPGDIIGITTNIAGLDISHTGIAIRTSDNRIHLMHAPSPGEKVQISKLPIADYVKSHKSQTGVMVGRPFELIPKGTPTAN